MFRIGEFSKIAQVAGSQLRYYDEIGLLKPAKIDKWTGYRFYSAQQLPELNRILALRDLGLSLDQIKRMLEDDISSEEIRGMFALKKAQVEQNLRDEVLRLQQIEARLTQIDQGNPIDDYDIIIKSVPAQTFLSYRDTVASFGEALGIMLEIGRYLPAKIGQKSLGALTAILHSNAYELDDIDLEFGYTTTYKKGDSVSLPSERVMTYRELPAVEQMVTAVRVGMPSTSHLCRNVLASWVESNGYVFNGIGREVFHIPPFPGKEDETVMEIQYPIERGEDALLLAP